MFGNHEFYTCYRLIRVIVYDIQAIVATKFQATSVVGYLQLIVGIGHDRIDAMFEFFYDIIVEAFQPVGLEDVLRTSPISLTMLQPVNVAMAVMREFIKSDVQEVVAIEPHYSW